MGNNEPTKFYNKSKPKIWVTGHPNNFRAHFNNIEMDILLIQSCDFYSSCLAFWPTPEDKFFVLSSMQLVVVPVTKEFLADNTDADDEISFARNEGIPILPICMEQIPEPLYRSKFGRIQYLKRTVNDSTEIPYAVKLSNYLECIFPSDLQVEAIKQSFDAHIFLSYRKKNRYLANQLMHNIHQIESFRDIAIFYDELLKPGEEFNIAIMEHLINCDLFVLLATKELLEPNNYVLREEYPAAKRHNRKMLGVRANYYNSRLFSAYFRGLSCVEITSHYAIEKHIRKKLGKQRLRWNTTPEHDFLIGLAYFNGICLEVDHYRGIQLITKAAVLGVQEAIDYLSNIYWANTGYHKNLFSTILKKEAELHRQTEAANSNYDRFLLLCEVGEGYMFLSNPEQVPAHTVLLCVNRAKEYLQEAFGIAHTIEPTYELMEKLSYAYLHYGVLDDHYESKLHAYMQSVEIPRKLVHRNPCRKNLGLLADMLVYFLSNITCLTTMDLENTQETEEINQYYIRKLLLYKDVMQKLNALDPSQKNVRRYFDALCKCATYYETLKDVSSAISCYNDCLQLGKNKKSQKIIHHAAIHLAAIYVKENDGERVEHYMRLVMDQM